MQELWAGLQGVLGDTNFWTATGAIFTVIAASAIVLAARQLKFDAWLKAQELFVKNDFRKARKVVLEELKCKPFASWTSAQRKQGLLVCRRMDEFVRLAPFLGKTFLLKNRMLDVWYDPIGKCWSTLEPLVREEQKNWPEKWDAFETVGMKATNIIQKREQKRSISRQQPAQQND
jgi:hypothetical protein